MNLTLLVKNHVSFTYGAEARLRRLNVATTNDSAKKVKK